MKQIVTILNRQRHPDGMVTVLVQVNDFDSVDDATVEGTNATHVLLADDVRGQLIDLYPGAEIYTPGTMNEKLTTHLIKLGKRVYTAQRELVEPTGPVKKAAIKANLAIQDQLIAEALMLSAPAVDPTPEL
jgi:hypothetical protein